MNRIIILGNGFDIAHGLKTKYSDFISHYYKSIEDSRHSDEFVEFSNKGFDLGDKNSLTEIVTYFSQSLGALSLNPSSKNYQLHNGQILINFKNKFFQIISLKNDSEWVDIEMEYFNRLLSILDSGNKNTVYSRIAELNLEVDAIAKKFEAYLKENVVPKIISKRDEKMASYFRDEQIDRYNLEEFLQEFPESYSKTIRQNFEKELLKKLRCKKFNQTLILNFNYTNTAWKLYTNSQYNWNVINIHGSIDDIENPINLGFGDENHNRYSDIENANQNEYLRLMKSFAYTRNDNYRQLFNFVEDDDFQVQIMGHSCGLSDRTLLRAIFENKLCKSIKLFFHEYRTVNLFNQKNNHSEIVRNISRHFTQKTIMRNKIVNESLCVKLPQFDDVKI